MKNLIKKVAIATMVLVTGAYANNSDLLSLATSSKVDSTNYSNT